MMHKILLKKYNTGVVALNQINCTNTSASKMISKIIRNYFGR